MAPETETVWQRADSAMLQTMRSDGRVEHRTRGLLDSLISVWFGGRPFEWLDTGVMGMVDYERLRPRFGFRFTGTDVGAPVVRDAQRFLTAPSDHVREWDLMEPLPSDLVGKFDLATARHVLNHCPRYEEPLDGLKAALKPGGRLVINLHLALTERADEYRVVPHPWGEGTLNGNYYNRERFVSELTRRVRVIAWIRADNGKKPNDIFVCTTGADGRLPTMFRWDIRPGRRHLLNRWMADRRLRRFLAPQI